MSEETPVTPEVPEISTTLEAQPIEIQPAEAQVAAPVVEEVAAVAAPVVEEVAAVAAPVAPILETPVKAPKVKKSKEKKSEEAAPAAPISFNLDDPIEPPKIVKAKGSKNITHGVAHVQSTFNNTIVSITDLRGAVIGWSSAGKMGFKGSRKSTAYAAQMVAQDACRQAMGHGLKEVMVKVKGPGSGRESAENTLERRPETIKKELLAYKL